MKRIGPRWSVWVAMTMLLVGCATEEVEPPAKPSEGLEQMLLQMHSASSGSERSTPEQAKDAAGPGRGPAPAGSQPGPAAPLAPGSDSPEASAPAKPERVSDETPAAR